MNRLSREKRFASTHCNLQGHAALQMCKRCRCSPGEEMLQNSKFALGESVFDKELSKKATSWEPGAW